MQEIKAVGTPRPDLQAVVVIHGMGEQIPMDTIKDFVRSVWQDDKEITRNGHPHPTEVWSKPDPRTGSLELRRITTRETIPSPPEFPAGVRTDFYELYWADLTAGATWDSLEAWVSGLLFRPLSRVPKGVRLAWAALWLGSLIVVALAILAILPSHAWAILGWAEGDQWQWALAAGAVLLSALVHRMGTSTFGRVVRYTRASPDNIAARAEVRDRGLKLLRAIHDGYGPQYKRVVIVAHSLGTILAHDLLGYFWAECEAARTIREGTAEFDALCRLEHAAAQLEQLEKTRSELQARNAYLAAQRELRLLLSARPAPKPDQHDQPVQPDPRWRISDLVTFGSPLTHAEFLIAKNEHDLGARKAARELPECPPYRERLDPNVFERARKHP